VINRYSISRYITAVLYDFFIDEKCPDASFKKLAFYLFSKDLEFLRLNKLAVGLGLLLQRCYSEVSDLALHRIRRYFVYLNEARNIYENFADAGIDVVVIKTIGNFPKDVSDIDLLIASEEKNFEKVSYIMKRMGYHLAKPGLEQNLWRRIVDGIVVDVEIHTGIAAADYEYYPKKLVFERTITVNGVEVPSPIDSILIMASHVVMKDLYMTLSDALELEITLKRHIGDEEILIDEAKRLGLEIPLLAMLYYSSIVNPRVSRRISILKRVASSITLYSYYYARPTLLTTALSYFHSVVSKIRQEPLYRVLREVISLPRGKGIDAFIYYITGLKPSVKRFEE